MLLAKQFQKQTTTSKPAHQMAASVVFWTKNKFVDTFLCELFPPESIAGMLQPGTIKICVCVLGDQRVMKHVTKNVGMNVRQASKDDDDNNSKFNWHLTHREREPEQINVIPRHHHRRPAITSGIIISKTIPNQGQLEQLLGPWLYANDKWVH